jgi:hypothetical protein
VLRLSSFWAQLPGDHADGTSPVQCQLCKWARQQLVTDLCNTRNTTEPARTSIFPSSSTVEWPAHLLRIRKVPG